MAARHASGSFLRSVYAPTMAFELVIHSPDGDIVLGSYHTKTAAEKMAAITIPRWLAWSVAEVDGEARAAQVLDFAAMRVRLQMQRLDKD